MHSSQQNPQNPNQKRPHIPTPPVTKNPQIPTPPITKKPQNEDNNTKIPTPPITKKPQKEDSTQPKGPVPVPTSWADRVRVTNSSTRHTLVPIPQQPPGSRLLIPAGMKMLNVDHWSRCMIGCFTGYRIPYHAVNLIARKVWDSFGLEQVFTAADGFFIFRFKSEEDVLEIIEKGPWMFGGKNIILQKWTPHFQFDRSKISHVSVWIRLRGLPLPLWTKEGLSMAASMVGKPQSCDEQTINCKRLDYARLCVELDASLPFIRQFEVESPLSKEPVKVTVEYEWKPSRCEVCHSFGHKCPAPEKTNVGGATPTDGEFQQPHGQLKAREETHTPDEASPRRQEAEGARHRSRSRPKQREGKQPWIEVSPPRQATKKVSDLGHQMSEPAPQTIPLQQVSESSKQSTVGTVGQKGANSRKDNQLCLVESQGQEGTPNTGMDIEVGVEEEGSSMPQGSHVSSEGDEPTTTSPAVRKKKSGRKKKGARGL
ncbi:hypothetical protein OIU78_022543 [Salix suchowensis]|nr:hypothetical protein OIU78_022543 [Salix suchowensis]